MDRSTNTTIRAAGMYGLLSEILGSGALSRHGDADLIERVQMAVADHEAAAEYYAGLPQLDPLDTPLPCAVRVDGASFGKGVPLRTFVEAAGRWRREAYGPPPTKEEAAANLAALQAACGVGGNDASGPAREGEA